MSGHEVQKHGEIEALLSTFKGTKNELIPILQSVQGHYGYLPEKAMLQVARFVSIPESKVYATATFYSQFKFKPLGENHICLCQGTACHVGGSSKVQEALERHLGISAGETTADLKYSLETVACIGCCALAPCMTVNGETIHGLLTPRKAVAMLTEAALEEEKYAFKNLAG